MTLALSLSGITSTIVTLNEDAARVDAALRGDREAFRLLVVTHGSRVRAVALAVLCDVAASEEISQDAFFAAWTGLRSLRQPERFGAWVVALAKNLAIDALRKRVRRPAGALDDAADPAPGVQQQLEERERDHAVGAALESLDPEEREVLVLYYREGESLESAAAALEIREDAARKRLSRARARLRDGVERRLGESLRRAAPGLFVAGVMERVPAGVPPVVPRVTPLAAGTAIVGVIVVIGVFLAVVANGGFGKARPAMPTSVLAVAAPASTTATPALARATESPAPLAAKASSVAVSSPKAAATVAAPVMAILEGVVLSEGTPAAGVSVSATCHRKGEGHVTFTKKNGKREPDEDTATRLGHAMTDTEGAFRLSLLAGVETCLLAAEDPIRGSASGKGVPGGPRVTLNLELVYEIRGRIVGPDGAQLDASGVLAVDWIAGGRGVPITHGAFSLRNVDDPGEYKLRALLAGYPSPKSVHVTVPKGKGVIEVAIAVPSSGTRLTGRVVDALGQPIANANVFLHITYARMPSVKTDAEGRFDLGEHHGDVKVLVKHADHPARTEKVVGLGAEPTRDLGDLVLGAE